MKNWNKYLGSFLAGATLLAPMSLKAAANQAVNVPVQKAAQVEIEIRKGPRYYDPTYRDYHYFNPGENRAYRHWLMEERREQRYRDYNRLRREQQREYWRWRHEHSDWR